MSSRQFILQVFRFEMHFTEYCSYNENTPNIELVTLPSPSPRFAKLYKVQKAQLYINLLPKIPAKFT